jgi:hypothetical protein
MVYFEDLGTTFDLPFEQMGAFMQFEGHLPMHDEVRNFEVVEANGPTVVIRYERKIDGEWVKSGTRMTGFAPYGSFLEEIEGDLAGSKWVLLHRPDGAKTRIELYGDIQLKGKSPEEARRYWQATMDKTHAQDLAALERFKRQT